MLQIKKIQQAKKYELQSQECGSPEEIRTPVKGSRGETLSSKECFVVEDIEWTISDFWQYCKIEERLSKTVHYKYKNAAKKFLQSCNGKVSRQSIREFLKPYLQKAPATYNNKISALTAFVARYLQKPQLMKGFKRSHVPDNYDTNLPNKQQLKQAFNVMENDCERAIFLMFASAGLRLSEVWNLRNEDVDFETRCIKSKHNTRTKRAGVTFYNSECEQYLKRYLDSKKENSDNKLFVISWTKFSKTMWRRASRAANIKITAQILRKWHATTLGEKMVPDRFVDIFQGRAPKSVLAKHYTGKGLVVLKKIYLTAGFSIFDSKKV